MPYSRIFYLHDGDQHYCGRKPRSVQGIPTAICRLMTNLLAIGRMGNQHELGLNPHWNATCTFIINCFIVHCDDNKIFMKLITTFILYFAAIIGLQTIYGFIISCFIVQYEDDKMSVYVNKQVCVQYRYIICSRLLCNPRQDVKYVRFVRCGS